MKLAGVMTVIFRKISLLYTVLWGLLMPTMLYAASEDEHWSVSIQIGAHAPQLTDLQKLYQAPTWGVGTIEGENDQEANTSEEFIIESPLQGNTVGAKTSLTFHWHANNKHSIIFGLGTWESTVFGNQTEELPQQGSLREIFYERRAKMSYTELSTGWRYDAFSFQKLNFYTRLSLHEVFDLDYRDDTVFTFFGNDNIVDFRRIVVMQAQTASLLMGELGLGVEWEFNKWFGIGFEGAYLFAERRMQLKLSNDDIKGRSTVTEVTYFPYQAIDGQVGYLTGANPGEGIYKTANLDFSGWQVLFSLNIKY